MKDGQDILEPICHFRALQLADDYRKKRKETIILHQLPNGHSSKI